MIASSSYNLFFSLPYPMKCVLTSMAGCIKYRQKYGKDFQKHFEFLVSSNQETRQNRADDELEAFLTCMRKSNTFYKDTIPKDLDLNKIPIIEKSIVTKNANKILMLPFYKTGKTSGTTGKPIEIFYSKNVYQKEFAFWLYHRSYGGVKIGNKIATIAGHKVTSANRDHAPFWTYSAIDRQLLFSSYHLSLKNLSHYINKLNDFEPALIHGYPSSIYLLARYILENDIRMQFRPKMIVTSSEATLDFQRKIIEKAFKSKVYIWYGNIEFCGHITECPYGNLHVQPYHSFVRVITENGDEAQNGEMGRIVATNFSNYAFPLINYDTNDIVKIGSEQHCSCNSGGRIVDYIVGRTEDFIITPEGRVVVRLGHLFKDAKYVRNAQIEQNSPNQIVLRIEPDKRYSNAIEIKILKEARSRLGNSIEINFEYVKEIKKEKNGKFKFLIQKMKSKDIGDFSFPPQ